MKHFFVIASLLFASHGIVYSQNISNIRAVNLSLTSDTIQLDTLSILPNSVFIFDSSGRLISDTLYRIDYGKALLIPSPSMKQKYADEVRTSYKVFPFSFSKPYFHKDISSIGMLQNNEIKPFKLIFDTPSKSSFFDRDELTKKGSISRGISFGNNQDVIVNSNLNLQLSGKISDNLEILAAISDNNIPIQPDGNTQQIQEFDKVFIQLFNKTTKMIVGDYEITRPRSYFMNINKKVQGGIFNTEQDLNKEKKSKFKTIASGAVSKGKYNKLNIQGIEGNQGPYKLTGAENERYIIILAGTENIYIDGKLLKRGQENDYTIDYNNGELTFTTNQPITKDKRITMEFQYSDKNYVRFLIYNSNEIKTEKGIFWVNIFSEQDSKNQPLDQILTDEQKNIMEAIGDSLNNAIVPKIDSVGFKNDMVLYKRIDTLIDGILYDSIYVYSTHPDSAFFRLGFSYVGAGNGNYLPYVTTANGKVYKWIAPLAGVKQGSHEPIILLVTPKKKQMATIGGEFRIRPFTKTFFELALTNNDINTFSPKNRSNDDGYAFKTRISQEFLVKDTMNQKLTGNINFQLITANFDPLEQFRSIEFSRDWNLAAKNISAQEQLVNFDLSYFKNKSGTAKYAIDWMRREGVWNGLKNGLEADWKYKGMKLSAKGNIMNSQDTINTTRFIRHSASLSRDFKYFTIGIKEEQENNRWEKNNSDTLLLNSFSFNQYEAFIASPDSAKINIFSNYKYREDYHPLATSLLAATQSNDISAGISMMQNQNHTFKLTGNYRELIIKDTLLSANKPENTITGKIEYTLQKYKGAISTSVFYELGSGLELKKEFSFIEVAQGQGVYTWNDYNNNGITELNEFEVTDFSDKRNYIRIFTPTTDYVKTFTNQFNAILNLRPEKIWSNLTGLKKTLSRFSNQLAFRIDQKTAQDNILLTANPFANSFGINSIEDSSLISISSSFKNLFSFQKTHPVFGADFLYQETKNKILLVNGFDSREHIVNGLRARWNITKKITWMNSNDLGEKKYTSEFFSSKNYRIPYFLNETNLSFQPNLSLRFSLIYKYQNKLNTSGKEKSESNNIGTEIKFNSVKKGSFTVNINYINVNYKTSEEIINTNTPIAYEMLEGLMPGNNASWAVQFQRNLTNVLQMNLNYTGRISEGTKAVHTGGVQLRAVF